MPDIRAVPFRSITSRWRAFAWLILTLLVLGFSFQGTRGIWSTDEGRYSENALQMVDSGNYLVPAYNADRVNFTKPPMTYWLIAASVRVFGHSTWAVRAPYALAFVLTALLLCAMGGRLLPEQPWLPALVFGLTLSPFLAANVVTTDPFLTLFEALAAWGFIGACFGSTAQRSRHHFTLMWLGFGLAFLTKGPPGLLPLLGMIPFVLRRDGKAGLRRMFTLPGMLLFLVAGLGWYLLVVLRHPGLLDYFLRFEVYDRIFTPAQNRHPQWYGWLVAYGPMFTFGALPWWGPVARGLKRAASRQRWRHWWSEASVQLFLALWFVVPLAVFCLSRSRLPTYVLPLFLPLSLMIALDLHGHIDLTRTRQRVLLALWMVLMLALKGGVALYAHPRVDNLARTHALDAIVQRSHYSALVFVEDTDSHIDIEERTPWGMRLYLHKPIYGIAWRKTDARRRLCSLMPSDGAWLVSVDAKIAAAASTALSACPHHAVTSPGHWRHRTLLLVRSVP